jgi:hypothetical protein
MTGDRTCRHCGRPLDSSTVYQLTEIAGEFCSAACLFAAKAKTPAPPIAAVDVTPSGIWVPEETRADPSLPCCPFCRQVLIDGAAQAAENSAAVLVPIGARVEIETTVGTRIGRMVGYLEDGRAEVHIDGQTFAVAASAVSMAPAAAQIPAPAAVP